ncbi:MAG: hypothetical protein J2P19_29700, partial [Pseudonocardia sp.]|nr:hypothetical protein [Pseudonocardia sp.]
APGYDGVELVSSTPDRVVLDAGGLRREFAVARYAESSASGTTLNTQSSASETTLVTVDSALGPVALAPVPRFRDPESALASGSLVAPMPGTVLRIAASTGDRVQAGQPVLWLEAMKMEHEVAAPTDGVVSELLVAVGQQVDVGTVLAVVPAEPPAPAEPSAPGS